MEIELPDRKKTRGDHRDDMLVVGVTEEEARQGKTETGDPTFKGKSIKKKNLLFCNIQFFVVSQKRKSFTTNFTQQLDQPVITAYIFQPKY